MTSQPAHSFAAANSGPAGTLPRVPAAAFRLPASLAEAAEGCWQRASAPAEWGLTREQFQAALERSAARRFAGAPPTAAAIEAYLEKLYVRDLALACACSAGSEAAWESFVAEFRGELYRAARAITADSSASDLADSLYADLYGLPADRQAGLCESDGRRKSLFDYFHGRSKLGTWLRAVLAQRHVDEIRRTRRSEPIEDETGQERVEISAPVSQTSAAPDPERPKYLAILQAALTTALASLDTRDRLRLAYYYADDRTLAEIGKLLREHESTVSRQLDRTRRGLRKRVEAVLRGEKKMSEAQVRLCLDYALDAWPFDLALRPPLKEAKASRRPGEIPASE
jgi:RNA polymerase sigma factor (sigma-70 family)